MIRVPLLVVILTLIATTFALNRADIKRLTAASVEDDGPRSSGLRTLTGSSSSSSLRFSEDEGDEEDDQDELLPSRLSIGLQSGDAARNTALKRLNSLIDGRAAENVATPGADSNPGQNFKEILYQLQAKAAEANNGEVVAPGAVRRLTGAVANPAIRTLSGAASGVSLSNSLPSIQKTLSSLQTNVQTPGVNLAANPSTLSAGNYDWFFNRLSPDYSAFNPNAKQQFGSNYLGSNANQFGGLNGLGVNANLFGSNVNTNLFGKNLNNYGGATSNYLGSQSQTVDLLRTVNQLQSAVEAYTLCRSTCERQSCEPVCNRRRPTECQRCSIERCSRCSFDVNSALLSGLSASIGATQA